MPATPPLAKADPRVLSSPRPITLRRVTVLLATGGLLAALLGARQLDLDDPWRTAIDALGITRPETALHAFAQKAVQADFPNERK